ncbi:MAG: T9SS type A sorting domain-containing protein [Ignavibacteriaceae bacterium]
MKKILLAVLLFNSYLLLAQNAWINEIHYDNDGADVDEFVEVILQNSETYTLSDFSIVLYNGSGGASYDTKTLDQFTFGTTDPTDNSFSYYYLLIPGIQNGAPDGISLAYSGSVIQFLSYEGSFAATDGVANGITSQDIGVSETGTTPIGSSIGLTGAGTQYSDFTWAKFDGGATPGAPNTSQALPVELTSFTAFVNASSIKLSWNTATEINNYGFEVERTQMPSAKSQADWKNIGFVQGNGNSNSPKTYSFVDKSLSAGKYFYRLKQIDNDGQYEYSKTVEVNYGSMPNGFVLEQNYPNPFNPGTSIKFSFADNTQAALVVYNAIGQQVAELFNGTAEAGRVYDVRFDASTLSSGIYFYKLQSDKNSEIKKMILLR